MAPESTAAPRRHPELDGRTFLVCIGAAKCGTSWLHNYLGGLPDMVVSPLKELHFFNARFPANALGDMDALALSRLSFHIGQDGDAVANLQARPTFQASVDRAAMIYDDNAYFAHFARLCTAATRAFCDLTPAYSAIGPDGFAFMKSLAASQGCRLRILFVMRDPVARFWSQLRHLQQINPANDLTADWKRALASPPLNARADYAAIVSTLDTVFAPGDVLYLFYESLFTEDSLRRLCEFASVNFAPGVPSERHNETRLKRPLPPEARAALDAHLAPQYAFCRDRFADAVPAAWGT